jgi:hypothetical protein
MKKSVCFTVLLCLMTTFLSAADLFSKPLNSVKVDFGPLLVPVIFGINSSNLGSKSNGQSDVNGFGLKLEYERTVLSFMSIGANASFVTIKGAFFSSGSTDLFGYEAAVYSHFYPGRRKIFFLCMELGYSSVVNNAGPELNDFLYGSSFTVDCKVGWKILIKKHFIIEPYAGLGLGFGDNISLASSSKLWGGIFSHLYEPNAPATLRLDSGIAFGWAFP